MSGCNTNSELQLFPPCIRGDGFGIPINNNGSFEFSPFKMVFTNVDLTGARLRISFKSSPASAKTDLILDSSNGSILIIDEHNVEIPVFEIRLNEARYSIEMQFDSPGQLPITRKGLYMFVTNDTIKD